MIEEKFKLKCWFLGHDWTTAENEGISPTKEQLDSGVKGFWDYAKMYCKRCGHEYKGNIK